MAAPTVPHVTEDQLQQIAQQFLTQGATFKELKGLTDQELAAVYSVGHDLFKNGKHEEAENVFRFLCFFDHLNKAHWLGLGACRKARDNFSGAIDAFGFAAVLDLKDPRAALQAAECHVRLGDRAAAQSALNAVVKYAVGEQHAAIRQRATMMLDMLKQTPSQS